VDKEGLADGGFVMDTGAAVSMTACPDLEVERTVYPVRRREREKE